jgi:hypothetical protein
MLVDHVHYIAQTLWLTANIVWALGELWELDDDEPYDLYDR